MIPYNVLKHINVSLILIFVKLIDILSISSHSILKVDIVWQVDLEYLITFIYVASSPIINME